MVVQNAIHLRIDHKSKGKDNVALESLGDSFEQPSKITLSSIEET